MIIKKTTVTTSTLKSFSLVIFFSASLFRLIFGEVLIRIGLYSFLHPLMWGVIYAPFLMAVFVDAINHKRIPYIFLLVLSLTAIYFWLSLEINPSYLHWYSRDTYGVWDAIFSPDEGGIYGFLFFASCLDKDELYNNVKLIGIFNFIFILYRYFQYRSRGYWVDVNHQGVTVQSSYGLAFGYNAAFVAVIFLSVYFIEKKKYALAISFVSILMMLLQGSRGSSLVIMVFCIMLYIKHLYEKESVKAIISVVILGAAVVVIYYYLPSILSMIESFVNVGNLSSRTLTSLVSNKLFDDSGRSQIRALVEPHINNGPFWGHGGFGDRPYIGPYFNWGYCHNILLEFQMNFGKYPGIVLLGIIIYKIIKLYTQLLKEDRKLFYVFIIMVSICFKLLLSDTFWGNEYFWGLLAILFCWKTNYKYGLIKLISKNKRKKP